MNKKYLVFAKQQFGDKVNGAGLSLFEHSVRVALTVERMGYKGNIVTAALFHDIIEDTDVDEQELKDTTNRHVLNLVMELTIYFDGRLIKEVIKPLYKISLEARVIKLADILDNVTMSLYTYRLNKKDWHRGTWIPLLREYEKMGRLWAKEEAAFSKRWIGFSDCLDKITELRQLLKYI